MLGDADIRCWFNAAPLLRHPLHREFLALLGAVEKIKIEQLLVRKAGLIRQSFEIVQNVRTQVDSHGLQIHCKTADAQGRGPSAPLRVNRPRRSARREERFLSA